MKKFRNKGGFQKKARQQLSFQVAVIVLLIFIIFSVYGSSIFISSLIRLNRQSEDMLVDSVASIVSSSHKYYAMILSDIQISEGVAPITSQAFFKETASAVPAGTITPSQAVGNELLGSVVDNDILGISLSCYGLPPIEGVNEEPLVIISSDPGYIFEEIPDELEALMSSGGTSHKLFENGIPGMGLKGQYLVTAYEVNGDVPGSSLWYFNFKPMGEMILEFDGFFSRETRNSFILLSLVMGLSTFGILIIAIIIMGYLLDRRIAKPIEELSEDAERVMDGDLEVQAAIKPGEDFAGLKIVFNELVSNLNRIMSRAAGQEAFEETPDAGKHGEAAGRAGGGRLKTKSMTRLIIVLLFSTVFLISGILSIFVVNRCMERMVKKTKDKLVETEGDLMLAGHEFGFNLVLEISEISPGKPETYSQAMDDFGQAIVKREISAFQELTGEILQQIVECGLYGIRLVYDVIPPTPPLIKDYLILLSSEMKYIYTTPPDVIVDMIKSDEDSWKLFKDGFPEMGMSGECLVTTYKFTSELPPEVSPREVQLWSVEYKPMSEKLTAVNTFYDKEIHKLEVLNALSAAFSVFTAAIVLWFALGFLIRRKITHSIDELILAAREVADGNFDVRLEIRPGEELKSLKRAFNEMIKSMRDLIERSMQD